MAHSVEENSRNMIWEYNPSIKQWTHVVFFRKFMMLLFNVLLLQKCQKRLLIFFKFVHAKSKVRRTKIVTGYTKLDFSES